MKISISKIKPNPTNPRIIKDDKFRKLVQSLIDFPEMLELRPIVVNGDMVVLGGNMRLRAAEAAGLKELPVLIADNLTKEQEREFVIKDNSSFGEWDWEILANQWDKEQLEEWGLEIPNFAFQEEIVEDEFDATPPTNPITKLGDLYELNGHRLICGDSSESDIVEKVMNGKKANLFSTDPPYGVGYNDETGSGKKKTIKNDENDGMKLQKFLESVFSAWLPFLEKKAAWYIWHAQMTQGFFAAAAAAADVLIHRQIIWVKPSLIMGHGDYHWRHELCFYGWVKGNRPKWYADRKQDTIWNIGRETDKLHPTAKPLEIFARPMIHNTQTNSICAEPFAGSGGQFIAADQLNRLCYGMELDEAYCDLIVARWLKFKRQQSNETAITIKRNGKELSQKEIQKYLAQIETSKK